MTRRQILLLVALTLMWGFNWPVMKFSLREVPPLTFRALTMTGRAVILAFTMPVWTVLLGALLFGQCLTRRAGIASLCALAAVALLAIDELTSLAGRPVGVLWLQAAALSWALGTLLMKRLAVSLPTEALTVWMMVIGGVFFCAAALIAEPLPSPHTWSAATWASLVWGAVINFGISQLLWFALARELPAQASAFSMMAVPMVGVLSSALVIDEALHPSDWVALLFIAAAIAAATGAGARRSENGGR
jgi:drug/metabolite transporter (DMT)-like permease